MPNRAAHSEAYFSVQLLRFVAAMLVVMMHTTEAISLRIPSLHDIDVWVAGASGVDIFFVISGFVMVVSFRSGGTTLKQHWVAAAGFMKRRFLRVVPLYWFYTLLKLLCVLALPALALRSTLVPEHILASFLFIPAMSPWGLIQPLLPVGWTLNFEMLFYLLFALAIALNANRLWFCLAAFTLIHILATYFSHLTVFAFYGRSILFEFVIGMFVARLREKFVPATAAVLMIMAGIALIAWHDDAVDRLLRQGLGSGLLLMGSIQLERSPFIKTLLGRVSVLGEISYSCYLCHSFVVPFSVALLSLSVFASLQHADLIIALTLALVVGASFASYFWIERPLTKVLKRHLLHTPTTAPAPTTPVGSIGRVSTVDVARIENIGNTGNL